MDKGYIYMIFNTVNQKQYIGQTNNLRKRIKDHVRKLEKDDHYNIHLQNSWNKYGGEKFRLIIIEENILINNLNKKEKYWIRYFNTFEGKGYNMTSGGKNTKLSDEAIRKIRESKIGENNPMYGLYGENNPRYGQTHTKESKRKISENHADVNGKNNPFYGCEHTEETKKKIKNNRNYSKGESHPLYGRTFSKEHKEKISKNHADVSGENNPNAKVTYDLAMEILKENNDGMTYEILSNKYNLAKTTIGRICRKEHWVFN